MNDIHLNLSYDGNCSFLLCEDLGNYGYDSPISLLETVLIDMQAEYGSPSTNDNEIDMIIISGDYVVHGLSSNNYDVDNWP
jgi:hypothetical protein